MALSKSDAYKEAMEKVRTARAEARAVVREVFNEQSVALLDDLGIKSFSWTQYTPYFNDGDACVFRVHGDYPEIDELDEYEGERAATGLDPRFALTDEEQRFVTEFKWPTWADREKREFKPEIEHYQELKNKERGRYGVVANFLNSFDADDMLFMFGDHAKVTVTKDGANDEECEHD